MRGSSAWASLYTPTKSKNRAFALFLFAIMLTITRVRATYTFSAPFLLLEYVDRHADDDDGDHRNYDNIYHAFFLARIISETIIAANVSTAAPPMTAGTTASDAGETISVPTV